MKNRFYPLLALSVLFLVVSFVLLCILGYNFYRQQKTAQRPVINLAKNSLTAAEEKTRDTLKQIYAATMGSLPAQPIDSTFAKDDTIKQRAFDSSMGDVIKLKTEITSLLKDSTSTADLELARYKIKELQIRVDELRAKNTDVEKENKRLRALLEQLAFKDNTTPAGANGNVVSDKSAPLENINSTSPVFSASDLKFAAANGNDAEVLRAEEAEKFTGSLTVRNSLVQGTGEVMIVLIQPDGRVLRNAWESGSFETDGGKKIYSRKIKFDYNKGEARRLNFSVPAENLQKGTYTLQVYNNGKVIGKIAKVIS